MKIAARAIEGFLSNMDKGTRACLLYGPDSGLARERMGKIKSLILGANDDPFSYVEIPESRLLEDPARLADELNAISLMGGRRLIVIRDASDKTGRIIEGAAEFFHEGAFVLAMAGELPAKSTMRAWFEKGENVAALACYKDEARDVAELVRKSFAEAGIEYERDVVEYLSQQLGNDRFVTRSELDKIITYAGDDKTISLAEVRALVDYNRDTELDDIVNAVADRNLANLEKTLTNLTREGTSPVTYIRAMLRYFNRLYKMKAEMETGVTVDQLIQYARPPIFYKQVPILTRHLNIWNIGQIARALKLLTEAELACKTSDLPIIPASTRKLLQVTQLRS